MRHRSLVLVETRNTIRHTRVRIFQVDVIKRDTDIDLGNYVSNGEWELVNDIVTVIRNVEYYRY